MKRTECQTCFRPIKHCYCDLITKLSCRWQIQVFQHNKEKGHPLNTCRIAELGLSTCTVIEANDDSIIQESMLAHPLPAPSLLLYPGADSVPIREFASMAPGALICLDANWKKSHRMLKQSPWLQSLQKVTINTSKPPRYRIRQTATPNHYSTLEAIVYALTELGPPDKDYTILLAVMDWMIDQQIKAMGQETFRKNYPVQ